MPPHHAAHHRHVPPRGRGLRRRQPAVVRARVRGQDPLGGTAGPAAAGGRGHAGRRRRGARAGRRHPGAAQGRPAAGRPRLLRGERPGVVGAAAALRPVSRRNALVACSTSPASSRAGRCTSGPARCSARPTARCWRPSTGSWCAPSARRPGSGASTTLSSRALHRRRDRGHRGPVRGRAAPGRRAALVGGRGRGRRGGPAGQGPLTVTDMICWHVGMGMGLYGVKALGLAAANRRRIPGSSSGTSTTSPT